MGLRELAGSASSVQVCTSCCFRNEDACCYYTLIVGAHLVPEQKNLKHKAQSTKSSGSTEDSLGNEIFQVVPVMLT